MKLALLIALALVLVVPTVASGGYKGVTRIRYANAWCESGGNIHAIGWRGIYRGKWQFDRRTWRAYAPRAWRFGDPAWVPEWVQDAAALNVPYDAWPEC